MSCPRSWCRNRSPRGPSGAPPILALGALLCGVLAPTAQSSELEPGYVQVRARVEPREVYVGQKVEMVLEVLTRTWFLGAPRFPQTLDLADALVLPPEGFGVNFTERISGETWAGQSRKLTIFPTRPGVYTIPPETVRVVVADDNSRPTPELAFQSPPTSFTALLPEAARGLGLVVATPSLTATQEWSRGLDGLRTGDAVRRSVSMTIQDSAAMLLPALEWEAPAGVSAYSDRPEISDRRNRGEMTGTRVESATYVFEEEGTVVLPDVEIHWWDVTTDRLRTITLPGAALEVTLNPNLELEMAPEDEQAAPAGPESPPAGPPWRLLLLVLAAASLLLAARQPLGRVLTAIAGRLRDRSESEAPYFRRFRRAARAGDAKLTLIALYAWLDRFAPGEPATLEAFAHSSGDPELGAELDALLRAATLGDCPWSATSLVGRVARVRAAVIDPRAARHIASLPSLNP